MSDLSDLAAAATEQRNPRSATMDKLATPELVELFIREEDEVTRALAGSRAALAAAVDLVAAALLAGGRLFYTGAGTSGRLGVLDASEIPPDLRRAAGAGAGHHRGRGERAALGGGGRGGSAGGRGAGRGGPRGAGGGRGVRHRRERAHALCAGDAAAGARPGGEDDPAHVQSRAETDRGVGRRDRPRHRSRAGHRLDPAQGRHGDEGRAQYPLDLRDGAARRRCGET